MPNWASQNWLTKEALDGIATTGKHIQPPTQHDASYPLLGDPPPPSCFDQYYQIQNSTVQKPSKYVRNYLCWWLLRRLLVSQKLSRYESSKPANENTPKPVFTSFDPVLSGIYHFWSIFSLILSLK